MKLCAALLLTISCSLVLASDNNKPYRTELVGGRTFLQEDSESDSDESSQDVSLAQPQVGAKRGHDSEGLCGSKKLREAKDTQAELAYTLTALQTRLDGLDIIINQKLQAINGLDKGTQKYNEETNKKAVYENTRNLVATVLAKIRNNQLLNASEETFLTGAVEAYRKVEPLIAFVQQAQSRTEPSVIPATTEIEGSSSDSADEEPSSQDQESSQYSQSDNEDEDGLEEANQMAADLYNPGQEFVSAVIADSLDQQMK